MFCGTTISHTLYNCSNHIGDVMVSVLAPSALDRGFGSTSCRVDVNTVKLVFAALLLGMQY